MLVGIAEGVHAPIGDRKATRSPQFFPSSLLVESPDGLVNKENDNLNCLHDTDMLGQDNSDEASANSEEEPFDAYVCGLMSWSSPLLTFIFLMYVLVWNCQGAGSVGFLRSFKASDPFA